jgi:hypothetical protein
MLEQLITKTVNAYSGQKGCACGCLGNYYDSNGDCWNWRTLEDVNDQKRADQNIRRITKKILTAAKEGHRLNFFGTGIEFDDPTIEYRKGKGGRVYRIYFS